MFKNIYYDSYKNKIHLWEIVDGKHRYESFDHEVEYYVEDKTKKSPITDIYGTPVIKRVAESTKSLRELRKSVKLYESDVSEEIKFLQKRYGNSEERVDPTQYNVCVLDIEVASGQKYSNDHLIRVKDTSVMEMTIKEFVVLDCEKYKVFDEEKKQWVDYAKSCYAENSEFPKPEFSKYPINLITLNFTNKGKIYTFGSDPYTGKSPLVNNYIHDKNEKQLLEKFIQFWRKSKVDIAVAYNAPFDFGYILKRCENLGIDPNLLSPVGRVEYKNPKRIRIHGITILDYIDLYKKFSFTPQPSYKLENVAMSEIKEGKTKYEGNIFTIWKTNWNLFVEYNVQDTILVEKMDKKRRFINLAIKLAMESIVPIDKCMTTTAIVEGYILKTIHKQNKVMSDRVRQDTWGFEKDEEDDDELEGAYVEAHPGFYNWLMSFDVESLYPHMIMMYNISPETKLSFDDIKNMDPSEYITTPVEGVYYKKTVKGILPLITEEIFQERKKFKKLMKDAFDNGNHEDHEYFDGMQHNRKILINCFHKDTEIMTPDGIRLVKDVKEGDLVYSINPDTLDLEVKPVMGTVKKKYTGKLNVIDSQRFKVRVTPEHDMLFIDKNNKKTGTYTSDEFVTKNRYIPIHNKMKFQYEKYIYINEHIDTTDVQFIIDKDIDIEDSQKELDVYFGKDVIELNKKINVSKHSNKYVNSKLNRYQIDNLIDVLGYEVKIKHNRGIKCSKHNVRLDVDKFSTFVGWYLSEGSARACHYATNAICRYVSIAQDKEKNEIYWNEINNLTKELFSFNSVNDRCIRICSDIPYMIMVDNFGKGQQKHLYGSALGELLNKELVQESMYKGDGTKEQNIYTISMKNPKLKDDYCRLLLELGYIPRIRIDNYSKKYTGCYRIIAHSHRTNTKRQNYSTEMYDDYVYCVNVKDNHTVIVGEDGRFNFSRQCLYGCLGSDAFHFYNIDNASVVTAGGRELIKFLSSNANDYLRNFLPPRIGKYYETQHIVPEKKTIPHVVVIDTDSCYVNIESYYKNVNHNMSFIDFANDFDHRILTPFFNKLVDIYCEKYNIPNKINFKREKIITKMFVQVKKKYVCQIIANEGEVYDHPKIKITGLETKKSDLPGFCKKGLNELIDVMFSGEMPDEEAMVEVVRKYQKIHKFSSVEEISIPKGVKDYKKYSIDFSKGLNFLPSTPIHNRASINHNYMVQKYKLPFREIDDGAKVKYVFVNPNNELHQNVVAFNDDWPELFDLKFKIDRDTMFEKTFLDISQRMFDALGFRKISLKENKMGQFLKKKG